jgi:drug/metabolite transporter (DMT)-like permease
MTLTLFPALLMLLSGSIHAVVNALIKTPEGGGDRLVQMIIVSGSSTVLIAPFVFFVDLPRGAWGWIAGASAVHIAYFYTLVKALDGGDLSSAYPIFRGTAPLLTLALAVGFQSEAVTPPTFGGIALICAGMLTMVAGKHVDRATLGWSLATGGLIAVYTVVDATGVRKAPTAASFIVWLFFAMGIVTIAVLPWFTKVPLLSAVKAQWRGASAAGVLSIVTFGLALYAFSLGPTAPLAALRETGMVTALILSIFVLKEKVTIGRVIAILTICAGAMLIILG